MPEVNINKGYEIYQIITDFGDPLAIFREAFQNAVDEDATEVYCKVYEQSKISGNELIIDIWNNGKGLPRDKVSYFFDLAQSTKVDKNLIPHKGKLGYKGHGSKIFFNSKRVIITSKTKDHDYWTVELNDPIKQIEQNEKMVYSEFKNPSQCNFELPVDWKEGFFVRIVGHLHFRTRHTKFKLNHKNIRDYAKWFTVFGSVRPFFDGTFANKQIKLFLHGLDIENFKNEYNSEMAIYPSPDVVTVDGTMFEVIPLGHYFPPERKRDSDMKAYAANINSDKAYYHYYSRIIFRDTVSCSDGTPFNLIINLEGYETKRRYDILLTKRGRSRTEISHTDSERYGIWACKGGIPIEKIDDWVEGAKGTYSFMQAFVDCDRFSLTANRGSIHNSDIEVLELVKKKLNEIFGDAKVKSALNERKEIEEKENLNITVQEDERMLKKRFSDAEKKKIITLPDGTRISEPTKGTSGYSESETLILFVKLMAIYPRFFSFNLKDYNTSKGIDFVVDFKGSPKYIELKGTMHKAINHSFHNIYKFICYEVGLHQEGEIVADIQGNKTKLIINSKDKFASFDDNFKDKQYKSYQLISDQAAITSMEVIELKSLLTDLIGAKISLE